jgi:hypothetical protein
VRVRVRVRVRGKVRITSKKCTVFSSAAVARSLAFTLRVKG